VRVYGIQNSKTRGFLTELRRWVEKHNLEGFPSSQKMQLTFLKTVSPASDQVNKVTAIAFSPNNLKLAVATQDRIIQIFDETGERKDRFSTKANLVRNPISCLLF
jgi:hypothetical protein